MAFGTIKTGSVESDHKINVENLKNHRRPTGNALGRSIRRICASGKSKNNYNDVDIDILNVTQKRRFRFFRILLTNSVNGPRCNGNGRHSGHRPTTLLTDKYTIHT